MSVFVPTLADEEMYLSTLIASRRTISQPGAIYTPAELEAHITTQEAKVAAARDALIEAETAAFKASMNTSTE